MLEVAAALGGDVLVGVAVGQDLGDQVEAVGKKDIEVNGVSNTATSASGRKLATSGTMSPTSWTASRLRFCAGKEC